jgi:hypothetical protein
MATESDLRPLTDDERQLVERIRRITYTLYEGKRTPHRSCGISVAETFGRATAAYQSLRKGGITGEGECGSIKAGELVIGELLGDPDPTGKITDVLREGAALYRRLWIERFDLGAGGRTPDGKLTIICNDLIRPLGDFFGPERHGYCTVMASEVAALTCEVLLRLGVKVEIPEHLRELAA